MEQTDIVIIGAGLLGCFAARALAEYELHVTVLEAREDVCTGVSRANTGIIYTGCDTKPGTLKTRLCVRANAGFAALCRTLDVPFSRCGSLMISVGPRGEAVLRNKLADGAENGVPGLELLSGEAVRSLEPGLSSAVTGGLYAPGSGTVNPWALGIAAFENAAQNGVRFCFRAPVRKLTRDGDGSFLAETDRETFRARAVINCAGLAADRVRELCLPPRIRVLPSAADYLVTDTTVGNYVNHIIFHEPEEKGKGLTLVPTVDGNLLIGPTERDHDGISGNPTDAAGLEQLRRLCGALVPGLPLDAVIRSFGAVRPNPYYVNYQDGEYRPEARSIGSFTLLEEDGLFSLIGIKTPGLTCAAELGRYLAERLIAYLGGAEKNGSFDPVRRGIPRPAAMPEAVRAAFLAANPDYGVQLCRCRQVSRGEVLEAIRRGAVSADGVKRRVGAGMGRCQGSRCLQSVLEELAGQTGRPVTALTKDGAGSEVLHGAL